MHEGGSQAPTPSNVAEKLAQQNLAAGGTDNTEALNAHIVDKALEEHGKKLARREARAAEKAEKARNKEHARANGVQGTGPKGPAGIDPAAAVAVVVRPGNEASSKPQDVEKYVGEANGKAKCKRGQRKRGHGGQGAKVGPDRQQAVPVAIQGRPTPAKREQGGPWIPDPDNRPDLLLPHEQKKAEVDRRLSGINRLKPTRWDLLYKPPGAARLVGTTGDLLLNQLWTTADANVRLLLLTADRPVTTRSFWALSLGPSSLSRNVCYGSRTGTEATVVLKQIVCTLAQVDVTHVRAILHHYCAGGSNSWLTNHTIPQGRPLAGSVSKN
jgi:hypothetical protein